MAAMPPDREPLMRLMNSLAALLVLGLPATAFSQIINNNGGVVGGVGITTNGFLQYRQMAATAPAPPNGAAHKSDQLYISLPRVLAQWRAAKGAGVDPPADVRYLKGLTRIQDIFLYPADHDIVLAGPAEP